MTFHPALFQNKIVLVTGGSSGIGLATAKSFIKLGATVVITGRNAEKLQLLKNELGANLHALVSDAGNIEDIKQLFEYISDKLGRLDIAVFNAVAGTPVAFQQVTEDYFDALNNVVFKGTFFATQEAVRLMPKGSAIVVVTSISNQVGSPNFSVYAAAKAACRSLVQTLSLELVDKNIRINAVSPGPVDTPGLGRWNLPPEVVAHIKNEIISKVPLQRMGLSQEIADAILFLSSPSSSFTTGEELVVDGGLTQAM